MVQEENVIQNIIYYVSKIPFKMEGHYPLANKIAFALVFQLKNYINIFKLIQLRVYTNLSLRNIYKKNLRHLEEQSSGR